MKTDLRNLVTAEEACFADSVYCTSNLGTNTAVTTGNVLGAPAAYLRDLHRQHVGRSGQQGRRAEVRLSLRA